MTTKDLLHFSPHRAKGWEIKTWISRYWRHFRVITDRALTDREAREVQYAEGYPIAGYGFVGLHYYTQEDGRVVTGWRCDASSGN